LGLRRLPKQFIRVRFADFYAGNPQQEHQRLNDAGEFNHVLHLYFLQVLNPSALLENLGSAGQSGLTNFDFSLLFVFIFFGFSSDKLFNVAFDLIQNSRVVLLVSSRIFL